MDPSGSAMTLLTARTLEPASIETMESWSSRGPRPSALIRKHRAGLHHVLVSGGTADRRAAIARAFHDQSALAAGAFVVVDATAESARLESALLDWLAPPPPVRAGDALRLSARGTLYIEQIEHLSPAGQRRLLAFLGAAERGAAGSWAGRLIAGSAMALEEEVAGGRFLSSLFDTLDKVRVHLGPVVEEPRDPTADPGPGGPGRPGGD